jgi:hypothetical protein
MDARKVLKEKAKFIPPKGGGYNLVGVDTFDRDAADAIYLVGNYPTRKAAEAAKARREAEGGDDMQRYHIYGPEDSG